MPLIPMTYSELQTVVSKWSSKPGSAAHTRDSQLQHDIHMIWAQKQFRRIYKTNVFLLHESAMLIQHWFFKRKLLKAACDVQDEEEAVQRVP